MKLNIEVELDYIDEDGNLDETIKNAIMDKIIKTVMEKVTNQVDSKLDDIILKVAKKKADNIVNEITENFMNRKFNRIDEYGDTIEMDLSVKDILKQNFEKFWNIEVDENGKTDGYGKKKSRIEWKIDEMIKNQSDKFAQTLTKDTENKIKNTMRDSLSKSIGTKLVTELGFDKLLLESK